jgi:3-phenylpropionate/cinnamic acid dioxygenase small subunit
VDLSDRLTLHELPGRYGDLIDDRDWEGLSQIFTDDATFEIPDQLLDGLAQIRGFMAQSRHPRTHLMTNVHVDETSEGMILHSRLVGMRQDGTIISGRYRDMVVKGPDGWRVARRVYTPTPRKEPTEAT